MTHQHPFLSKKVKKLKTPLILDEIKLQLQSLKLSLRGLFIIQILKDKEKRQEWYKNFK
jgi:hypothetical protein